MEGFDKLIFTAVGEGYSDVHITGAQPIVFRKHGLIDFEKNNRWPHEEVDRLVGALLTPRQLKILRARWSVDFAVSVNHVRLRINVFNTIRGLSVAIRILPGTIPSIPRLNLHPSVQQIAGERAGFVLVCGATGAGKSTTIAAIVDEINREKTVHVVTLEDPIEYRYSSKNSFIEQRELGTHVPSFEQGLIDVLREDPDVIVVGELRDTETMRLALNAAESGHLVIASLHASNSEDALYRIFNSFPPDAQEAVRTQLASTLTWLSVQRLEFIQRAGFRVPVLSIVRGTSAIRNIIRENKLAQIESAIQTGRGDGMFTIEGYLKDYIDKLTSFASPEDIFRPTPESVHEAPYYSPLLYTNGDRGLPEQSAPGLLKETAETIEGPCPAVAARNSEPSSEYSEQYVIEEQTSLEELVNKINKSGIYRDKQRRVKSQQIKQ
jgi:pilus retraction protein PilT